MWQDYPQETCHTVLHCGIKRAGKTNGIRLQVVGERGSDTKIKQSRCYGRLLTSQHVGVHDQGDFQDPSRNEMIFL
jgi:hypothetical protein